MKQEMISFLTEHFNDVKNICEYLYKNPKIKLQRRKIIFIYLRSIKKI